MEMTADKELVVRENGIHYTPPELADLLVREALVETGITVLDPACGEGSLLAAARRRSVALGGGLLAATRLIGCDKLLSSTSPVPLPNGRYVETDFFDYGTENKCDVVLMNPPFVRARMMARDIQEDYARRYGRACELGLNADIWAYFLIKARMHLRDAGRIAAILPWAFLQADYARSLRRWVADNFHSIRVLVLGQRCFPGTNQRVLLAWLGGAGSSAEVIEVGFSDAIAGRPDFRQVGVDAWCADVPLGPVESKALNLVDHYSEKFGLSPLREHADVRIGIVTGADSYFILSAAEARSRRFPKEHLVPILTTSQELTDLSINCRDNRGSYGVLLTLPQQLPRNGADYQGYIAAGEALGYHERTHSRRRDPWYAVQTGPPPDGFFPYRASRYPFLALNASGIQCTNSIHRIYFHSLTENQRKWLQISLLSDVGQLSLEIHGKVYGNGVLKIEPKSLKRAVVWCGDQPAPQDHYDALRSLVRSGDRPGAVKAATGLLDQHLGVPSQLSTEMAQALDELMRRRGM